MWIAGLIVLVLSSIAAIYLLNQPVLEVPELPDTFWGPQKNKAASKEIRPFKISIQQTVIDDLHKRLDNARPLVEPFEGVGWTYGISTTHLKTILNYWRTKYNWTERQTLLNKYPQFKTNIQGLDIHFYHVKPSNLPKNSKVRVIPLLIVHGWPGSVVEFQKIIPILTTPQKDQNFVFEVIAPSLPGYGFSDGAVRPGLAPAQIAVIFKNLMSRLGFEKYYVQGGDWGAAVVSAMSTLYPNKVIGVHSNMCVTNTMSSNFWMILGGIFPSLLVNKEHHDKIAPLGRIFTKIMLESGYMHIQATKPDTIGTAVSASPVAMAAYILEKFSTWTNSEYRERADGGLQEKFTLDELLDNVMLYWVTNSMTTSMRIYAERFSKDYVDKKIEELPVLVPTGCAFFPHELLYVPESLLRARYKNMIQATYMPRGGHFPAFEEPELMAGDIFSFVSKTEHMLKEKMANASQNEKKEF